MAEENDGGFFREIEEELRQEKAATFAKQYGPYVIAAVVVLVGGVGGFKAWESHQTSTRIAATDAYISAVREADRAGAGDAISALTTAAETGVGGIDQLAGMRLASELADSGDSEGAIAAFQAIVNDADADTDLRALASVNLGSLLLNQGDSPAAIAAVQALTTQNSAWQHAALEISALAALDSGDVTAARGHLERIINAGDAPSSLRARATTILGTLPVGENG